MFENTNKNLTAKQALKIFAGILIAGFVLIIIAAILTYNSEKSPSSPSAVSSDIISPKILDMSLAIRHLVFLEGYSVSVVTIKNLNNVNWQECEAKINDKYTTKIDSIFPLSFWGKQSESLKSVNKFQILPVIWFIKSDGSKFNPIITAVKSVCVICHQPKVGAFCSEFKQPF